MYKLLSILFIFSLLFSQETMEPCDGQCLPDEVIQTLYVSIQELEHADTTNQKMIENLNSQIYMYIRSDSLYQGQIEQYEKQIELQNEMIKVVKPKWHENKYLWYAGGVLSMIFPIWAVGQAN